METPSRRAVKIGIGFTFLLALFGIASRAEARMNTFLKLAWAMLSVAQTKRVPSCTPTAPISR